MSQPDPDGPDPDGLERQSCRLLVDELNFLMRRVMIDDSFFWLLPQR